MNTLSRMSQMIALSASVAVAFSVFAEEWTDPDTGYAWPYETSDSGVNIQGFDYDWQTGVSPKTVGNIAIPETINGLPVTEIGYYLFYDCTDMTGVTIPDTVETIGFACFEKCRGLTQVTIPDTVKALDRWAFVDCSGLISVKLPNSVESIGYSAFQGCFSLTNVVLSTNLTRISHSTFQYCSNLTAITIPRSVESIGSHAFMDCVSLEWALVPSTLEDSFDKDDVFANCNANLQLIYYDAAMDCDGSTVAKATLSFDANGGDVTTSEIEKIIGGQIGALPNPTRDGYYFTGWWTEKDGGEKITNSTIIQGDMTLYAHWTQQMAGAWTVVQRNSASSIYSISEALEVVENAQIAAIQTYDTPHH